MFPCLYHEAPRPQDSPDCTRGTPVSEAVSIWAVWGSLLDDDQPHPLDLSLRSLNSKLQGTATAAGGQGEEGEARVTQREGGKKAVGLQSLKLSQGEKRRVISLNRSKRSKATMARPQRSSALPPGPQKEPLSAD